ncbi:[NiFe]-hydrogenase assembly chaperone HybE [Magnetovibrio sp. PR-2]|uniref:[NiFe]-hydrogenase assembly chaperone HybE n=1 Tax=Magnetovibrio sp. PR-2 TaxID=3120356 RepID=UPI002FCDF499
MTTPEQLSADVQKAFQAIYDNSLKGLPIENPVLEVEAIGFTEHDGRIVGVITTPWLMTLLVFPRADEDWSNDKVGTKKEFPFPAREYECLANEIEGVGPYYGYAIYSPMHEFEHHPHAQASATAFMEVLMVENPDPENSLDEKRFKKFLSGEDMDAIKEEELVAAKCASSKCADAPVDGAATLAKEQSGPKELSRRSFLSGGVRNSAGPNANA